MTVLITGANGFVGAAVLRRLVAAGQAVRALVRPGSNRRNLAGLPVEIVEGDLLDSASRTRSVAGCSALFHVAADYRLWVRDPAPLYAANVEGTRGLLLAAGDAGVRRIVYTSSVAVLGHRPDGRPADETTGATLADMIGHYKRSKFLAEAAVSELVAKGLPVVTVNPSTPVGPGDVRPTPTGRLIVEAARGRVPAFVETGLNIVHVDDVAEGHWLAYGKGRVGERYVLGGDDMSLRQILTAIAWLTGRRPPTMALPHALVMPIAVMAEAWARLFGGEPFATVDGVRMARAAMFFSSAKAMAELGYRPRPAEQALRDAVAWFRANGYCN
ncbi:MAG: NAD-dependent epimerase/dehydratase family protein [Alphaproteobacteria bacterium]|nr:NAD-dependent epimerase/dehydratase family protein [Alphaproteobacteria bacterium]